VALTPDSFEIALQNALPEDLPNRTRLIKIAARHLELMVEANKVMNLTRILDAEEAAIKHVLDSVLPWRFFKGFRAVMDAGTGPGLPGIPLAIVLPDVEFTLCESVQKKAHFVEEAVQALEISNITVMAVRAESAVIKRHVSAITARAVSPLIKIAETFEKSLRIGTPMMLYKGPDAEMEIASAAPLLRRNRLTATVLDRYDLAQNMGTRTFVELKKRQGL
jgi:16S rRNA (guanine527-N7)-methyltransferase